MHVDDDSPIPFLKFTCGTDTLVVRVTEPEPQHWPTSRDGSSFWARALLRLAAEFVGDDAKCFDEGCSAEALEGLAISLGDYFGRKGVQRCLTHISGFPYDIGFREPPCATRGPKKRKRQRIRRRVRKSPSTTEIIQGAACFALLTHPFAFTEYKEAGQSNKTPQG